MSRIEYSRADFHLEIARSSDFEISIRRTPFVPGGVRHMIETGALDGPSIVGNVANSLSWLPAEFADWQAVRPTPPPGTQEIVRIALDVADVDMNGVPWESAVAHALASQFARIVRVHPTRPRAHAIPFTLPFRVVELNAAPGRSLKDSVLRVFSGHPEERVKNAFQMTELPLSAAPSLPANWPSVDILHIVGLPSLFNLEELLSTAPPHLVGSVGWLSRITDRWQCRLVVLECSFPDQAANARRLASALVRRGGPAIVVGDFPSFVSDPYQDLYANIIHDSPLEFAVPFLEAGALNHPSLFGGAGREESLRVSSVGLALLGLRRILRSDAKTGFTSIVVDRGMSSDAANVLTINLDKFEHDWNNLTFETHEGEGLLPMADALQEMRLATGVTQPANWAAIKRVQMATTGSATPKRTVRGGAARPKRRPAEAVTTRDQPRFVNASLWQNEEGDALTRLAPGNALAKNDVYQLGIQIGPRDTLTVTVGAMPILEEVFKWDEHEGVWVEIGVIGLDFEVLGDPVQELWLPRGGASEMAYFAVRTSKDPVARLRICLYYRGQVIQSLRLAAVVDGKVSGTDDAARNRHLRSALGLVSEQVLPKDIGHAVRLEYSLGVSPEQVEQRPIRTLSLVANELEGLTVLTAKSPRLFETRINADVIKLVFSVRTALKDISFPPVAGVPENQRSYGFRTGGIANRGTTEQLKENLCTLAAAGWELFDAVFPERVRQKLADDLKGNAQIVHVAHVLLDKVIPWAAMYDRKFDAGVPPGERKACLAALNPDGTLCATECGSHPECLLNPSNLAVAGVKGEPLPNPETVACPVHFWGWRHIIEIPSQQYDRQPSGDARPQTTKIKVTGPAQLMAGLNFGLHLTNAHEVEDLDPLPAKLKIPAAWISKESGRKEIIDSLRNPNLHLIYFYCHARGGQADITIKYPYLEFEDKHRMIGQITSGQLPAVQWQNGPLVVLNGCGTAAFSPDALSPFVYKLVQDRGAAGVIGTEIPISEDLAREFARSFLEDFFNGKPAGAALLGVRQKLLAMNNPLGLVYVLYSAADLQVPESTNQ